MHEQFIRIYQSLDIKEIQQHVLIHGDLASSCGCCNALDLRLDMDQCPHCGAVFKYVAFRNVKNHLPKLKQLRDQRPSVIIIDFEDYQRLLGVSKAQDFFK
jgi:hypothetical protein